MNCSIIIRAYNEAAHLPRLLEGISHQTVKGVEVIVVDSGSTDDTASIALSFDAKVIKITPGEFTFGRSLNLGIREAKNEFVVIASAHVYPVYPDWLECLLRPFKDDKVGLVYGKQRGTKTSKFSEHQIFQQWYPDEDIFSQPSPFCNNANAAIRRSLWEEHPYDETLTGLEDVAWAKWAQSQGRTVAYIAKAEIIHAHDETAAGVLNRYRREGMAFKRIFPESHFNVYDLMRLTTTNILSDLWQAAREHLLLRNMISIFWFRSMQFWGTYQGYRLSGSLTAHLRQTFYYPRGMNTDRSDGTPDRDVQPIRYKQN
jgi:glycosyltransferase involved in cell wall biosynthesis